MQLALYLTVTAVILFVTQPVLHAQNINEALGAIGSTTKLPSFDKTGHAQASAEPGASNITSALLYVGDLIKYAVGTIAVLMLIISGIKLVSAGAKVEEVAKKQKESIKYSIMGLILIMVADVAVKQVFFGEQGEVLNSQASAQQAAERGTELLKGLYNFMEYFVGAIAVLMIVVAGVRMVAGFNKSEEAMTKGRKQITWAAAGLILIGLSEFLVKDIVFPQNGSKGPGNALPDMQKTTTLIINVTNFIGSFMATLSVVMIVYGGFMYVTAMGDAAKTQKGKKAITTAVMGLIIALAAFGIVSTVATFKIEPGVLGQSTQQAEVSQTK